MNQNLNMSKCAQFTLHLNTFALTKVFRGPNGHRNARGQAQFRHKIARAILNCEIWHD